LKEAARDVRGEKSLRAYEYEVPGPVDVKAIRGKSGLSQSQFARRFGSVPHIARLELGRAQPPSAVRAYLTVIDRFPETVEKASWRGVGWFLHAHMGDGGDVAGGTLRGARIAARKAREPKPLGDQPRRSLPAFGGVWQANGLAVPDPARTRQNARRFHLPGAFDRRPPFADLCQRWLASGGASGSRSQTAAFADAHGGRDGNEDSVFFYVAPFRYPNTGCGLLFAATLESAHRDDGAATPFDSGWLTKLRVRPHSPRR